MYIYTPLACTHKQTLIQLHETKEMLWKKWKNYFVEIYEFKFIYTIHKYTHTHKYKHSTRRRACVCIWFPKKRAHSLDTNVSNECSATFARQLVIYIVCARSLSLNSPSLSHSLTLLLLCLQLAAPRDGQRRLHMHPPHLLLAQHHFVGEFRLRHTADNAL